MGTQSVLFSLVLTLHLVSINIIMHGGVSEAMSTITMAKDQVSCTMCSSCDNPCQPVYSPPPPSPPPPSPPLPSPPPPIPESYCPPPPSQPPVSDCPPPPPSDTYYSPPPPGEQAKPPSGGSGEEGNWPSGSYNPPPSGIIGSFPIPPPPLGIIGPYPIPPPPNPIVPYFPFYYYNPPSPSPTLSSITWRRNPTSVSTLITIIFVSVVFYT